jgi:hypothetical protein
VDQVETFCESEEWYEHLVGVFLEMFLELSSVSLGVSGVKLGVGWIGATLDEGALCMIGVS